MNQITTVTSRATSRPMVNLARLLTCLSLVACATPIDDSVESVEAALELENGGFEMTDELPAFGDESLFTRSEELSEVGSDLNAEAEALEAEMASDECGEGRLRGQWREIAPGRGIFRGFVRNASGEPIGHIRGVYGVRANGDKVFFGKYINADGEARGLFRGTYGDGHFSGQWRSRSGDTGQLRGAYRKGPSDAPEQGRFIGQWREVSCDA